MQVGRDVTEAGRHSKVQPRLKRELRATRKRQNTSYCAPGVGCGGGGVEGGKIRYGLVGVVFAEGTEEQ